MEVGASGYIPQTPVVTEQGLPARGLVCIEANTMAPAFEKWLKTFIVGWTSKGTGGKAQICLPDSEFGVMF